MLSEKEKLAYLAGIIDGEGCIGLIQNVQNTNIYFMSKLTVGNTNRKLIDWLLQNFGGDIYDAHTTPPAKVSWIWSVRASDIASILERVLPYLIVKEEQAIVMLQYRKTIHLPGRKIPPEVWYLREQLFQQIRDLKREHGEVLG